jgi:hypothetical protein
MPAPAPVSSPLNEFWPKGEKELLLNPGLSPGADHDTVWSRVSLSSEAIVLGIEEIFQSLGFDPVGLTLFISSGFGDIQYFKLLKT